jgi:hypothetical protein
MFENVRKCSKMFRRRRKSGISNQTAPGLLDGIFSNQKSQFGSILEGLGMEKVGKYFGPFGIYCGH